MNGPIGQTRISSLETVALGLHVAVFMPGDKVLGNETFRLVSFQGQESMSDLFEYNLELHGNTENASGARIDFSVILGRPITVGISLPGPDSDNESDLAFSRAIRGEAAQGMALFNGIVASFSMEQPGVYRITMRPALWKLGLSNGYRHFSGKNIRDVVSEALNRYGVEHVFRDDVDYKSDISVTRIQDWLQAGESDLELVRRLLGKAHLFYFFEHRGDGHAMVIAGGETAYGQVYDDRRPLRYTWSSADELGMEQEDVLLQYSYQETLTSSHVAGTYVRQQAVWENDVIGVAHYQLYPPDNIDGDLPFNQYKVFQYGLCDQEANYLTKIAENALDASRSQLSGSSRCPRFCPGKLFSVSGRDPGDGLPVQPSLEGHQYVLTMVKHQASLDGSYQNEFQALPKAPVLPFSLQDTQQGAVLAKVVPGEPKDWRYYPRSVFDPQTDVEIDLQADKKELHAKGVTVELATGARFWARLPVHASSAPEVGSMVMVSRANDESELPEISLISSDGSMTVTSTGWTAHSSVGNSYSTSWGDSKSIRCGAATPDVLDDARGIVESAYQSGQYKDSSYSRGGSYGYSTSENGRSGLLSRSESYGNTYNTQEADETKSRSDIGYSYSESTVGESYSKSTVTTSTSENTVTTSVNTSTTGTSTNTSTTGTNTNVSATGISTNTSATGIQTDSSATLVQNSASVVGMQNGLNLMGMSTSIGLTGMQNSLNLTGMQNSVSVAGSQENVNLAGSSINTSLTGSSVATNLTGSSVNTNLTGSSVSTNLTGSSVNTNLTASSVNTTFTASTVDINIVGSTTKITIDGPVIDIDIEGALVMHMDEAEIKIHVPGIEIKIDDGLEIHL